MTPQKIILMANDTPGLEVCRYLVGRGDTIARLYLHAPKGQKRAEDIVAVSGCADADVMPAELLRDGGHVAELAALGVDWIITVYWAHLISQAVIDAARKGTVNFHPALLPINRGWYPHVHSLIDGSPTGVTIHSIDASADTGPVWAQKKVEVSPYDTAYTIYNRLQDEIVELFRQYWPSIASGELRPTPQDESLAVYHGKKEIESLDAMDPDATMRVRDVINLLRARTFGDRGFAYYDESGRRVYVNVRLSDSPVFE